MTYYKGNSNRNLLQSKPKKDSLETGKVCTGSQLPSGYGETVSSVGKSRAPRTNVLSEYGKISSLIAKNGISQLILSYVPTKCLSIANHSRVVATLDNL